MAEQFTLDIAAFRVSYVEFANPVDFPETELNEAWDFATCFMPPYSSYGTLSGKCRYKALTLLTAHILKTNKTYRESGFSDVGAIVNNAREDLIDVASQDIPASNTWEYNLNTTKYGRDYVQLLSSKSKGGFYGNPRPVKAGFLR